MKRVSTIMLSLLLAAPSAAQGPDWSRAARVEVALASFKYNPKTIRLPAGRPVVLHLVNTGRGGHDFTARDFFAAAAIRPADRAAVQGGRVELKGGQSRDIALVPKAGHYRLKCTHTLHSTLGMTGQIIVE